MAFTATQKTEAYQFFIVAFGAAPGADYWTQLTDAYEAGMTTQQVVNVYTTKPQFQTIYPADQSNEDFAAAIVENVVGATATAAAKQSAVDDILLALNAGLSKGDVVYNIFSQLAVKTDSAKWGNTAKMLANKVAVAEYVTEELQLGGKDLAKLQGYVSGVTQDAATVATAKAAADAEAGQGGGATGETFTLTQLADNLTGTDGNDIFKAPVTQNMTGSGELANTFETGDVLDGGAGFDTLQATLIATGTIQDHWGGAPIAATTTSIERVEIKAQAIQADSAGSNTTTDRATIDAGDMSGVKQWVTTNSRANVRIEDIRSTPQDTTFEVELTDPRVGFEAYFNPMFMQAGSDATSTLTLVLQEITGGVVQNELANITVHKISFKLNGTDYTLDTADIRGANTWAELEAAVAEALEANAALSELTVAHRGNGVFEIVDGAGGEFAVIPGEALILGNAADIDVRNRVEVGRVEQEHLTETTLILDGVGAGSQGGAVNIAAMSGDRGVEVFHVQVDRDSHISALRSENNPRFEGNSYAREQMLEEVYVEHLAGGRAGDLQIGDRTVNSDGESTTTDDRLATSGWNGLTDVRVFDAQGFTGAMKIAAQLTDDVTGKYLDRVTSDPATAVNGQFDYLMGDGGSNLSLRINEDVARDGDFTLNYVGGAGADRLNLDVDNKRNINVDGGAGENTLEVTGDTTAATAFESFKNIQTLVVTGGDQQLVSGNMGGLERVIVATREDDAVTIGQIDSTQELILSGKNQVLDGDNNANQELGAITVQNATVTPGSTFTVTLDNAARLDGNLTVRELAITGTANQVDVLNLVSAGQRNTTNTVEDLDAAQVSTFHISGTQALDLTLTAAANSDAINEAARENLVVNASELTANIGLTLDGDILTSLNDADKTATLTGAAGAADVLTVVQSALDITSDTTVAGFETVQFGRTDLGAVSGRVDLLNFSGVTKYEINATDAAGLVLFNLNGNESIDIDASGVTAPLAFIARSENTNNALNLNYKGGANDQLLDRGLVVMNYKTINLDLASNPADVNLADHYSFDLVLLDDEGDAPGFAGYDADEVFASTLVITGGNSQLSFDGTVAVSDTVDLNTLSNVLTRIDVSGFAGATFFDLDTSVTENNVTIVLNSYSAEIEEVGDQVALAALAAAETAVANAETAVANAEAGVTTAEAAVTAAEAVVTAAQAAVDVAQTAQTNAQNAATAAADALVAYTALQAATIAFNTAQTITYAASFGQIQALLDAGATPAQIDNLAASYEPLAVPPAFNPSVAAAAKLNWGDAAVTAFEAVVGAGDYSAPDALNVSTVLVNLAAAEDALTDLGIAIPVDVAAAVIAATTANDDAAQDLVDANGDLADANGDLADANDDLVDANDDLSDANDDLSDANATLTAAEAALAAAQVAAADSAIVTYKFTADLFDGEAVVITGFDAFNVAGVDLTNLSILDLSALGVGGLVDLQMVDDGGNTVITSNEGLDFEIELVGVAVADLHAENFKFAA